MLVLKYLLTRLRGLLRRDEVLDDVDREMRSHIDLVADANVAKGMSPSEARAAAARSFGNVGTYRDLAHDIRGGGFLETLFHDARFGVRVLLKRPAFAAVAIATLAFAIGANVAIFSVVDALLYRPLPFHDPDRLVWIENTTEPDSGLSGVTTRAFNLRDWQTHAKSFEELGAYFAFFDYGGYNLSGAGEPERLSGVGVTETFLHTLGVRPGIGRDFTGEECTMQGPKAAILTHAFWVRRFDSDPTVLGRTLVLNGQPTTVVGVLSEDFDFASVFTPGAHIDMLVPFPIADETNNWGNTLAVVGRLRPGVTRPHAQAEIDALDAELMQSDPNRGPFGAKLTDLRQYVSGRFRAPLAVLFAAVACVLLIACANLSNMVLAWTATRREEVAVRIALGARRVRLIRQILTESVLLACCGAVASLPLAYAMTRLVASTQALNIPLLQSVRVDPAAVLFALTVAVVTGLVFGLAPALQLTRMNVSDSLKDAVRGSSDSRTRVGLRSALIVGETAVACVLLVGAGLLVRSFVRLLEVDPGFVPDHAVAIRIDPARDLPGPEAQASYYAQLVESVSRIPDVESVGLTDTLPLSHNRSWNTAVVGRVYPDGQTPTFFPRIVDRGYLHAMRIPLLSGRQFGPEDGPSGARVIIVNEQLARSLWPGEDALGGELLLGGKPTRVVGIAGNVRHSALEEEAGLEAYLPMEQLGARSMELVVRTRGTVGAVVPLVRASARALDPLVPAGDVRPLGDLIDRAVSPRRFVVLLMTAFSSLALLLTAIGVYGVISYSVVQRTREIGIRMALGARGTDVLRAVLLGGLSPALIGLAVGLLASAGLSGLLASLLFGVTANDPVTFVGVAAVLCGVALAACLIPAARAARVDPLVALRHT